MLLQGGRWQQIITDTYNKVSHQSVAVKWNGVETSLLTEAANKFVDFFRIPVHLAGGGGDVPLDYDLKKTTNPNMEPPFPFVFVPCY